MPVATRAAPTSILSNDNIEAFKWLALALMTLDHVNKYLFSDNLPAAFQLGRLLMPLFTFVLSYNLACLCALEGRNLATSSARIGYFLSFCQARHPCKWCSTTRFSLSFQANPFKYCLITALIRVYSPINWGRNLAR